jgi:hypothetical protein
MSTQVRARLDRCRIDSQPRRVPPYVSVGWPAVSRPVGTVSPVSPSGIETETGNDEKNVSASRVNCDPASWAVISILPKLVRRVRSLQPPNRMQNIRGCPGAIVSGIVKGCMTSSIAIRPADDLISRCNRLLHNWRSVRGRNRISKLSRSRPSRNIAIDVGRRCFATGKNQTQNQPTANSTKGRHGRERATSRSRNSRSYELTKAPPHFQISESVCRNESAQESVAMVESTRSAGDGLLGRKDPGVPNTFENGISDRN